MSILTEDWAAETWGKASHAYYAECSRLKDFGPDVVFRFPDKDVFMADYIGKAAARKVLDAAIDYADGIEAPGIISERAQGVRAFVREAEQEMEL